jgi:uncharacterized membrane protein
MAADDPGPGEAVAEQPAGAPQTPEAHQALGATQALSHEALTGRLDRIERLLERGAHQLDQRTAGLRADVAPAVGWVRGGELRWPISLVVLIVIALQIALPSEYRLAGRWPLAVVELVLVVAITAFNPHRIEERSLLVRTLSLTLLVLMSLANLDAVSRLVYRLLTGTEGSDATALLLTGAAIWLANVAIFALWYWEFDQGGPVSRDSTADPYLPDFLFAQMTTPEVAPPTWRSTFVDYLYLSFTNATAFSPTDTLPLARWAKMLMMLQSAVSLVTVALVIARAVNVLK